MNDIEKNIKEVLYDIEEAKKEQVVSADSTLIAVSKTKPIEDLKAAYEAGMRDFGENKVQELQEKMPAMPSDVRWHMIGHLQTNKIKYIVGKVFLIHSVDSLHLAEAISKESIKAGVTTDILIEINVAGEDSKFGTSDMDANLDMLKEISKLDNIRVKGLMTIAPMTDDAESNRPYFRKLREFAYGEARKYIDGEPILSMGMSGDYTVAVSEGASYVRVGSKIFGTRYHAV